MAILYVSLIVGVTTFSLWIRSPLVLCLLYACVGLAAIARWIRTHRRVASGRATVLELIWFMGNSSIHDLLPLVSRPDDMGFVTFRYADLVQLRRARAFKLMLVLESGGVACAVAGAIASALQSRSVAWTLGALAVICCWSGIAWPAVVAARVHFRFEEDGMI